MTAPAETVILVGAPGSGKSTVGALLAERMGVPFADVDAVIEDRAGRSISEIFTDDGEPAFRALEETTTIELLSRPGVVSLGGGAILSPVSRAALKGRRVVWLQVSVSGAVKRVGLNAARPLLLGNVRGRLLTLLNERAPLYAEVASQRVDTDDAEPAEIVAAIIESARV